MKSTQSTRCSRTDTRSEFHDMIIVARQIHGSDITTISVKKLDFWKYFEKQK